MDSTFETVDKNSITGKLRWFQPIDIVLVNGTERELTWDQWMALLG
ncbi:hypothetical protein skT53_22540 [Effusibacillus dendaii]|uniref:Uncharacterized protein n=1 Tax=Effusibacillus dendaii TaxID=2743772 RepID=A0A7I8DE87_9BACL|nr:hypothetical protein skT53_22540 [Effusibacillus dendaii]